MKIIVVIRNASNPKLALALYLSLAAVGSVMVAGAADVEPFFRLPLVDVTAVAAGGGHAAAIREDGTFLTWGRNDAGQLGNGTLTSTNAPQLIETNVMWRAVAAGNSHTVALSEDGTLWTWGANDFGQLGNGTFTRTNAPQPIQSNVTWRAVAAGDSYTLAVRADGTLWAWGLNSSGQLGDETFRNTNSPQPIATNMNWQAVWAGAGHAMALRPDGTLWAWGANDWGQLGNGMFRSTNSPQPIATNMTWRAVAAGGGHTVAVHSNGTLWAWGYNGSGQLGNGTFSSSETPQQIGIGTNWKAVAAGPSHTVALREDGTLWTWGNDDYGQLGTGAFSNTPTPTPVQTNVTWIAMGAGGSSFTLAVREDGTLYSWGDDRFGLLGRGDWTRVNTPQTIQDNVTWSAVTAGATHLAALREDGTLWAWGLWPLGDGASGRANAPQPIQTNVTWKAVAAGGGEIGVNIFDHTLALRADGTLWTWGVNDWGQLGNGSRGGSANTPQPIQPGAQWKAVAAGGYHSVALREDGRLWAWGRSDYGQIGNGMGNSIGESTPQPIQTNVAWKSIAAGLLFTVGLREDGTLWTWGSSEHGQLGNGTSGSQFYALDPQPIQTNETWMAIAAGGFHVLALQTNGSLWAWGHNGFGQLGVGPFQSATNPQPVQPGVRWKAIAGGSLHSVALREDGTLWTWGFNENGQLGNGTFTSADTPQPVQSGVRWKAIAAGGAGSSSFYGHTAALREDGTLWAWGDNRYGQIAQPVGWLPSPVLGPAILNVTNRPFISAQPANAAVSAGSTATFAVEAYGAPPLHYQWRFNTMDLENETNSTLHVMDVQAAQLGNYLVVVTNNFGAVTSAPATLSFGPPTIIRPLQPVTIIAGDNATFTVMVTNTATLPIGYSWRKGAILTNIVLHSRTCSFTLFNVPLNSTATNGPGLYRVFVTNAGSVGPGISSVTSLTVLPATAPTAATLAASNPTDSGATLNASINPKGAQTVAWFDYGLTTAYGGTRTDAVPVGNASNVLAFSQAVTGLVSGTNYHYRVVATNHGGMALGADLVFQTPAAMTPLTISAFELLLNGQFRLRFDSAPSTTYSVLVSTNLSGWTALGLAVELTPGHFEFTDADAPGHPTRFYQLRLP